jgi:hypothetical protein
MNGQPFPPSLLRLYPRVTLTSGDPRFSLQNVNTFILPDGCVCWIEAEQVDFRFFRTSVAPPGPDVVQPSAGPGRWHRELAGGMEVLDEGISLGFFTKMNFQGAGVTALAGPPGQVDVTIPGGGGGGTAAVQGTYTCDPGVAVLDAVFLSAADTVDKADADDASKQPLIGIVDSKPGVATAIVTYYGEVTGFVGLVPGDTYYLGLLPGTITNVAPSSPGDIVQRIGFAKDATTLILMVDRDWTLLT